MADERYRLYVDGRWVDAGGGRTYATTEPFAGRPWAVWVNAYRAVAPNVPFGGSGLG